ncbi:MAG: hypothetical protein F4Z85_08285 [Gemmatimonadetes bacterium]|nr:hypothetical protein [Gemmatimonadota bacterium]MYB67170.1 hypothetical protein [Gemmatimonadota bacterium]
MTKKIPARWKGEIVRPDDHRLAKGRSGYTCLSCGAGLTLKGGNGGTGKNGRKLPSRYFSHPPSKSCDIHKIIQAWVESVLLREMIRGLPPHPGLIVPEGGFLVRSVKSEYQDDGLGRRYDVRLEGMPMYNMHRDEQAWAMNWWLKPWGKSKRLTSEWLPLKEEFEEAYERGDKMVSALKARGETRPLWFLTDEEWRDYWAPPPQIHPDFYDKKTIAALKKRVGKDGAKRLNARTPQDPSELIFEVFYSNPKNDDFKKQMKEGRRLALEVDAKKFAAGDFTLDRLINCSAWLWPGDIP